MPDILNGDPAQPFYRENEVEQLHLFEDASFITCEPASYVDCEPEIAPAGGVDEPDYDRDFVLFSDREMSDLGKKRVAVSFKIAVSVIAAPEVQPIAPVQMSRPEPQRPTPPINAQFLLDLFLPESHCEEFLGDLQERYNKKVPRLGKLRADLWYRKQVFTSLWPLFRAWMKRSSKGSLARVVCFGLRLVGRESWANALRKVADEERKRSI